MSPRAKSGQGPGRGRPLPDESGQTLHTAEGTAGLRSRQPALGSRGRVVNAQQSHVSTCESETDLSNCDSSFRIWLVLRRVQFQPHFMSSHPRPPIPIFQARICVLPSRNFPKLVLWTFNSCCFRLTRAKLHVRVKADESSGLSWKNGSPTMSAWWALI